MPCTTISRSVCGFYHKSRIWLLCLIHSFNRTRLLLQVLLLTHPKKDIRDTAEYQPFLKYFSHLTNPSFLFSSFPIEPICNLPNRDKTRKSLKHLASEFLGADIQNGEHCPVSFYIWQTCLIPLYHVLLVPQISTLVSIDRLMMQELQCCFTRRTEESGRETWKTRHGWGWNKRSVSLRRE